MISDEREIEMRLETKRLILREFTISDFDDLYKILSDEEAMRYYPKPFGVDEVKGWIEWNIENYGIFGFGLWAVIRKESGRMIGDCGITMQNINGKIKPEIGYHIGREFQNRGYATEAAAKCKDIIFGKTPFNALYSYMESGNAASCRVAEKNGMRLVEEYGNKKVYAITREEWEADMIKGKDV